MGDAKIMNAVFSDRSDDERVSVYLDTDKKGNVLTDESKLLLS